MSPDDPRHGERRGWEAGCRNTCCATANRRYNKRAKVRGRQGVTLKAPILGAQRRIQALVTLGWTTHEIAATSGLADGRDVTRILHGRRRNQPQTWIEQKTWAAIETAFQRLAMTVPTSTPYRERDRRKALAKGYAPPLAWNDIDDPTERPKGVTRTAAA